METDILPAGIEIEFEQEDQTVWLEDPAYDKDNLVVRVTRREALIKTPIRRVALVSNVQMALHRPLPQYYWPEAEANGRGKTPELAQPNVTAPPGALTSWASASASKERPQRLLHTIDELVVSGLAERCVSLPARMASADELQLAHSAAHVEAMLALEGASAAALLQAAMRFNYVFMNRSTLACARMATGCVLVAVEAVCQDDVKSAAAIVRPPGHHAECHCGMGFCVFNNVAVAAAVATQKFGLERVLVVDWDVHHGNGVQQIFEDSPHVLYFSVHRYDCGTFYPGAYYEAIGQPVPGRPDFVGVGEGNGFSVNLGWNCGLTGESYGDAEYAAAWDRLLMPIASQYNPQLVIVSAGFDSARGDPEGELGVTPDGYAYLTSRLMELAGGRLVVALEGGYNVPSVKFGFGACVGALLGALPPDVSSFGKARDSALVDIGHTIEAQRSHWSSLT